MKRNILIKTKRNLIDLFLHLKHFFPDINFDMSFKHSGAPFKRFSFVRFTQLYVV